MKVTKNMKMQSNESDPEQDLTFTGTINFIQYFSGCQVGKVEPPLHIIITLNKILKNK